MKSLMGVVLVSIGMLLQGCNVLESDTIEDPVVEVGRFQFIKVDKSMWRVDTATGEYCLTIMGETGLSPDARYPICPPGPNADYVYNPETGKLEPTDTWEKARKFLESLDDKK